MLAEQTQKQCMFMQNIMRKRNKVRAGLFFFFLMITMFSSSSFKSWTNPDPYGQNVNEAIDPYLKGVFSSQPPSLSNWEVEDAFPNLDFTDPLAMVETPDGNGFYVGGKLGQIWKISKDPATTTKTTVLDISSMVFPGEDSGLINFVLHPKFSDGQCYVYVMYRYHPDPGNADGPCEKAIDRLSRFTKFKDSENFDHASEVIMLQHYDPDCLHQGGGMFFGNDGFLYFTVGDGGDQNDVHNSSQQIDERLYGGMFRIDVDMDDSRSHPIRRQPTPLPGKPANFPVDFTANYYIPNDNPWQDPDGGLMEEFFALGFRSPHRVAFDPVNEKIYLGDVGGFEREEISEVRKGGNYQWPYREGDIVGPKSAKPDPLIGTEYAPIHVYDHTVGNAVIMGLLYRGRKWPSLTGKLIFGDHNQRKVWSMDLADSNVELLTQLADSGISPKNGISSFGTDSEGNIYILKLEGEAEPGGKIYKLKEQGESPPEPPALLSQTGAFADLTTLTPAAGLMPYTVNSPLWSDGAVKYRWIALPNDGTRDAIDEKISFSPIDDWRFPEGTVFIKHFALNTDANDPAVIRHLETRFFVVAEDDQAYGVTYRWREDQTDAELLTSTTSDIIQVLNEDGCMTYQVWEYPSRSQCMTCHNENANFVLGVDTWQLNGDFDYPQPNGTTITDNQLRTWNHLNMFRSILDEADIPNYMQAVPLNHPTASLEQKMASYWDNNCSHCHRAGGVEGVFDARYNIAGTGKKMIGFEGVSHNTPDGGKIIIPKDPENSQLFIRDNTATSLGMPPLAKKIVHEEYIDLLRDYIMSLEANSCDFVYLTDLDWSSANTGVGNVLPRIDLNFSKGILSIGGTHYGRGIGTHATSEIEYTGLNGLYNRFTCFIGIDDKQNGPNGTVKFLIYTDDNTLVYESAILTPYDAPVFVDIAIGATNSLKLVADETTNTLLGDFADWAEPRLYYAGDAPDSDGDGLCDSGDLTDGNCILGSSCDDGDADTLNDVYDEGCDCIGQPFVRIKARIALQGPWSGIKMNNNLQLNDLLPCSQPFVNEPWNYEGSETQNAILPQCVDWVLVQIRDPLDATNVLAQRACYVDAEGDLMDTDGTEGVLFLGFQTVNSGYVAIKHRNHLGIMTEVPVSFTN